MARKIKRMRNKGCAAQLAHTRAIAGLERERFFAENGDVKQWRPTRKVNVDRKRQKNKNLCRQKVRY
jgi:hypothetical protein